MLPTKHSTSRYLQTARRAYAARVVAAGALVLVPAACSSGDAQVFGAGDDAAVVATEDTTSDTTTTDVVATTTVPVDPTTTAAADTTTASGAVVATGVGFPAGAEMVVDFTYSPTSSAQAHNPYVAVWVEDADGNLIQTISLWWAQSNKGTKWLNDLRGWYAASGGDADVTTSGATRSAGSYSVVWDGTGLDGELVPGGEYVLFVEAAREHGPYEITSTPFTVDGTGFTVQLADNGELTALSATLTA